MAQRKETPSPAPPLPKPVDAERPAHTQGKIVRLMNSVPTVCGLGEQKAAVNDSSESFREQARYGQPQATSILFENMLQIISLGTR